jgi:hypothetical protein
MEPDKDLLGRGFDPESIFQVASIMVGEEFAKEFVMKIEARLRKQQRNPQMMMVKRQEPDAFLNN